MEKCTNPDGHEWRRVSPRIRSGSFLVQCLICQETGYELTPPEVVPRSQGADGEGLF